tara:strand:+ start:238 stop:543 length:306 start_codon:yes stop_codon:yes gene_type:complete
MNEEEQMNDVIAEIRADRKKRQQKLKEKIEEINPDAMLADGLDDALAGYDSRGRAIYHIEEILGILIVRDGMTEEEAQEFFDFNIECAHVGQFTPIYMWEE